MAENLFGFADREVDGSCWMFDGPNAPELISTGLWKNANKYFEVNTYKRRSYDMNTVDRAFFKLQYSVPPFQFMQS